MGVARWNPKQQGPFARRRRITSADVDFTSLIDVVFLLLIFFMLNSAIAPSSDAELPEARYGKGVIPEQSTVVTLTVPKSDPAEVVISVGETEAKQVNLEQVKEAVVQGVSEGKLQVLIRAEKKVHHRHIMEIARMIGGIEKGRLFIAVEELK